MMGHKQFKTHCRYYITISSWMFLSPIECTIGLIPPPGQPAFVGVPVYTVLEDSGLVLVYLGITAGIIETPRTVTVSFSTSPTSPPEAQGTKLMCKLCTPKLQ